MDSKKGYEEMKSKKSKNKAIPVNRKWRPIG
jgi:hypothetical protein